MSRSGRDRDAYVTPTTRWRVCCAPNSECVCIHLKTNVEKFYLLCLMTRKLFTFAKQECMEENPDSITFQEVLTPGQLYLMFLKVNSKRVFNFLITSECFWLFEADINHRFRPFLAASFDRVFLRRSVRVHFLSEPKHSHSSQQERMAAWLVSVKLAFEKKAARLNLSWSAENVMKIFNMGADISKSFEYLLATGNLSSKSGMAPGVQLP